MWCPVRLLVIIPFSSVLGMQDVVRVRLVTVSDLSSAGCWCFGVVLHVLGSGRRAPGTSMLSVLRRGVQ